MMSTAQLFSLVLELRVERDASFPKPTGHLTHALFFKLLEQIDSALFAQLHNRQEVRPFTISSLYGRETKEEPYLLRRGEIWFVRVTLLDGGTLWQRLTAHVLETGTISVRLGNAALSLTRLFSSPSKDPTGWARTTSWDMFLALQVTPMITFHFLSPTAFSMRNREFTLVPKPDLLWGSLLRVWNIYAPASWHLEKHALSEALNQIRGIQCNLSTETIHYPHAPQKGFVGTCSYLIPVDHHQAPFLTRLAAFAQYAGIGYKTTMGMGQTKVIFEQ